jgi:hypothetical protein
MSTNQKRSLLREAKQVMDASFQGSGDLANKVRAHIWSAYAKIANGRTDEAASDLVSAYELVRSKGGETDYVDLLKALFALDIGFFLYGFAKADDDLRVIGWAIWDARKDFQASLYDALNAAREFLSLLKIGVTPEAAIKQVITTEDLVKLEEILLTHAGPKE